jgi:oligopeptide/dipeptide ABC transporter ATP-binding protein
MVRMTSLDMTDVDPKPRTGDPLLVVENLVRHFAVGRTGLFGPRQMVRAVDGVSFSVRKGEVLGVVGESGCGKSSVAKAILNIHPPASGRVRFRGADLTQLSVREWRKIRSKIQYVFQDPLSSLDPRIRILAQVIEPLTMHSIGTWCEREAKAIAILEAVGLGRAHHGKFPHELSGGQQQRVVLARALVLDPEIIICDEPISALDVSIQAQVVQLLQRLKTEFGLTILFISHDLSIVRFLCDRVAVMYLGKIVEFAETEELFDHPRHPYTRALISAIPIPVPGARADRILLEGEPPSPTNLPPGCRFNPRCRQAVMSCREIEPALIADSDKHFTACHLAHGDAA